MKLSIATSALVAFFFFSAPVSASQYGCQVALCLANPGSPTEHADCVPPIRKLQRDLARGRGFPSCPDAGNSGSSDNIARLYAQNYGSSCQFSGFLRGLCR